MNRETYKAIGVLDSGVGGLTVVREIHHKLPHESIVYFGDTARMPYGSRPSEEVRRFVLQIIDFLQTQEIKMLVIACNTASAVGIQCYREHCRLPVAGVIEPGVRAALAATRNDRIGVIGTAGTINSSAYEKELKRLRPNLVITARACPLFVLMVENSLVGTPEALAVARQYLEPFKQALVDTLILGCTHYPLMSALIQQTVGPAVRLISSAEETAAEVEAILTQKQLLNPLGSDFPRHRFFVSGSPSLFEELGGRLLDRPIKAYQVLLNPVGV